MGCCDNNPNGQLGGSPTNQPCCPSKFCDPRLMGLPTRRSLRLVGTEGECLVQFPRDYAGVLLVDEFGNTIVSDRPKIAMPYQRTILLEDGKPVKAPSGEGYVEDTPPPFDSLIVSNCEGYQNRIRGASNRAQVLQWTGCNFQFLDANGELTLEDFQYVGKTHGFCDTYESCLVDMGDGTVKMGYRAKPTIPPGSLVMWGGLKTKVPAGWIICEGQSLSKALYPDLFDAWGYAWGGSGSNFNVPRGNGLFPRVVDDGAGIDPNAASRTAVFSGGNTGDKVGAYGKGTNSTATIHDFGVFLMAFAGCVKTDSPTP